MPTTTNTYDSHNIDDSHDAYQPNEVTTVPIEQTYNADNASTSENYNTANSDVDAGSVATGSTYGDNVYAPNLSSEGVSLVLTPSVAKLGTAQTGLATSATTSQVWPYLLIGAAALGLFIYLSDRSKGGYSYDWRFLG